MLPACASLNGPSVTMFFASVHLSPYFSTAFGFTARNDVWATCWTNHGCGEVSLTCSVCGSSALTPTLFFERVAVRLAGVVLLRADDAEELVRVVGRELGRDRPLPRVLEVARGHRIAVRPAPVRAELERDGLTAVAQLPALGQVRHRLQARRGAELDQRIHDVLKDVRRRRVGREARVERRGFGAPVDRDRVVATLWLAAARALTAAGRGEERQGDEERGRDEAEAELPCAQSIHETPSPLSIDSL